MAETRNVSTDSNTNVPEYFSPSGTSVGAPRRLPRPLRAFRSLSTALVVLALVASTGYADRRTSLGGNLLIDDQDDVFIFPNQIVRYGDMIALDYGFDSTTGSGLLTLGDGAGGAFGVAVRRGDALVPHGIEGNALSAPTIQLSALNPLPSLFPSATFASGIDQPPATMVDFLYGRAGSDSDWGLRLSFGRGAAVATDSMGDETGAEQLFLMGEFGYGMGQRGQQTRTDISVSALFDLANSVAGGADVAGGFGFGLDGLLRMYIPMNPDMDLGIVGNMGIATVSVTNRAIPDMEPSDSRLRFGLGGGVGPAMKFGDASIAAYATVRFGLESADPNSEVDDDGSSTIRFVVPGILASLEVPVLDWFYVRTGAQYDWSFDSTSNQADDSGQSSIGGGFGWNAGLGVLVDDFRFDGTLQQGFVTNGPNFIGGVDNNGFLVMASLTYVFDKQRDGMHRPISADEEAPAAHLAPASQVAPAPEPPALAAPVMAPTPPPVPAVPSEPVPPGPAEVPAPDGSDAAAIQGSAGGTTTNTQGQVQTSGSAGVQIGAGN